MDVDPSAAVGNGRIARIEVYNFKSYAGRRVIGPFFGFSAVVGPNGAGKSNLMDAISFCVGMRSSELRGKQLKDLIYRKTTDPADVERSASVTIVYEREGNETLFKRSISTTGVGEYRVNNKVVTAEVFFKRLKAVGILVKAHNGFLVFQGYVSELAGKSPTDLTALIEQISGSDELKEEYERLEKEKKKAEEDQIYSYQKKKGLMQEGKNMKRQKEEAERYKELVDQRRELRQRLCLHKLFAIEKEVVELHSKAKEAEAACEEGATKSADLEEDVKEKEREKARLGKKVIDLERSAVKLQQQLEGKTPEAIKLKEEIAHAERRKKMSEKSLAKLEEQQAKGEEQVGVMEAQLEEISRSIVRLDEQVEDGGEGGTVNMGAKQRAEYNELKARAGTVTAALTEDLNRKRRELRDLEPAMVQHRTSLAEIEGEQRAVESKLGALEERRASGQETVDELKAELKTMQAQRAEVIKSASSASSRRTDLEGQLAEVAGRLRSSRAEHKESERAAKSAEAIENMRRHYPGVHGRMTDICKPTQHKYYAAVTIAMGKNLDAIVVDDEKTARECIQYLKEKKVPPETFIPLDTIRAQAPRDALRQLGGTKKLVIDVVSAPEMFQRAVQFACADTIVCNALAEARELAYHSGGSERFKVVTLDGTLINKAGLITGGSSPGEKARIGKWDHKEYKALESRHHTITRELEELGPAMVAEEQELSLRNMIAAKQQELQTATADLELTKTKIAKHKKESDTLKAGLNEERGQLKAAEETLARGNAELQALRQRCDVEEDKIFAQFSKSLGLKSIREYEETHLQQARERDSERLALQQQQSKLQARVQFVKRKDLPAAASTLRASIAEDSKLVEKKNAQQAKAMQTAERLQEECAKVQAEAKACKDSQAAMVGELKTLKKELREASEAIGAKKERLTSVEAELEQQRGQRQRIFQRARLDEVEIPTLPAGASQTRPSSGAAGSSSGAAAADKSKRRRAGGKESVEGAGGSSAGAAFSAGTLVASESFSASGYLVGTGTLDGDGDGEDQETGASGGAGGAHASGGDAGSADDLICINFSSIAEEGRPGDSNKLESALSTEISNTHKLIDGMAPNMKALTQYDEVQGRLHSIESEFDTTRTAASAVRQKFAEVRAKRYKLFMSAFKVVSENIDPTYKSLTKVAGMLNGGTAYLSLEDPDEPYLHGTKFTAMPPSKRFRNMDQLSGGERTLAALALVFAMHEFRPSPFFVMDEIDAALDNVNVTRVAQYIRERASDPINPLQFVVISLKDQFYQMAHSLVGIYRDRRDEGSSVATLDLERLTEIDPEDEA